MSSATGDARVHAVALCVSDIEVADFVSLDLEFSGLFLSVERERRPQALKAYFQQCVESVPHFLPIQLGICCVRLQQETLSWELHAHEFNMWPQERRIFTSDLQSLRFLRAHGFDFNAFLEQAFAYSRLPATSDRKKMPAQHVTQILAALRSTKTPIVVHNGLLDMLHLYDKFVGDLHTESEAFCQAWVEQFPLLFDTRLIAQEGRFQVLKHSGGLSLEELHRHLLSVAGDGFRFERLGPLAGSRTAHGSAGLDAVITAEVFIMEIELWIRYVSAEAEKKRRKKAAETHSRLGEAEQADESQAATSPEDWQVVRSKKRRKLNGEEVKAAGFTSAALLETHEACKRFHNRVALVSASPGFLQLGKPSNGSLPVPAPAEAAEQQF